MFNIKVINLFCTNSLSKVDHRDYRRDPGKYRVVSFEQSIQKRLKNNLLTSCHTSTIIKNNYVEGNQDESQTSICPEHKRKKKLLFSLIHFRFKCILPLPTRTCCSFFDLCIRNIKSEKLNKNCLMGINPLLSEDYGTE